MALIGTGATMHAGIHKYAKAPVLVQQVTHLGDGNIVPVVHQLAWKAQIALDLLGRLKGLDSCHRPFPEMGNVDLAFQYRNIKFGCSHNDLLSLFFELDGPGRDMALFARVIYLVPGRAKKYTWRMQQLADRER